MHAIVEGRPITSITLFEVATSTWVTFTAGENGAITFPRSGLYLLEAPDEVTPETDAEG